MMEDVLRCIDVKEGYFARKYEEIEKIGSGGFGRVYRVRLKSDYRSEKPNEFAVKILSKRSLTEDAAARVDNEYNILKRTRHANIIELIEAFQDSRYIYFVLSLCEHGDLHQFIKRNGALSSTESAGILSQVVEAALYLHRKCQVIHRDIKPANVLLSPNRSAKSSSGRWTVKLADFGLAKQMFGVSDNAKTICGTPQFFAPEMAGRQQYSQEVDTWSIGCVLYNMLTGRPPFGTDNKEHLEEILRRVTDGEIADALEKLRVNREIGKHAYDLLRRLLQQDPRERIRLDDVLNHPFFTQGGTSARHDSGYADTVESTRSSRGCSLRRRSRSRGIEVLPCMPATSPDLEEPVRPARNAVRFARSPSSRRCNHSCVRPDDNVCLRCERTLCAHTDHLPTEQVGEDCTRCGYEVRPSLQRCNSYRSSGACGGTCTTKQRQCDSYIRSGACGGSCRSTVPPRTRTNSLRSNRPASSTVSASAKPRLVLLDYERDDGRVRTCLRHDFVFGVRFPDGLEVSRSQHSEEFKVRRPSDGCLSHEQEDLCSRLHDLCLAIVKTMRPEETGQTCRVTLNDDGSEPGASTRIDKPPTRLEQGSRQMVQSERIGSRCRRSEEKEGVENNGPPLPRLQDPTCRSEKRIDHRTTNQRRVLGSLNTDTTSSKRPPGVPEHARKLSLDCLPPGSREAWLWKSASQKNVVHVRFTTVGDELLIKDRAPFIRYYPSQKSKESRTYYTDDRLAWPEDVRRKFDAVRDEF